MCNGFRTAESGQMYLSLGIKGTGTGDKIVTFPLTIVCSYNALALSKQQL
jgi:hypothetical protein